MNSITTRNWDLLDCVNANTFVYWIILTQCTHGAYRETRFTSWLQAQVCQTFLRTKAPTYLIYHSKSVPTYGGNLIREKKICIYVCMCVRVCSYDPFGTRRILGKCSKSHGTKMHIVRIYTGSPSARRRTSIYSWNQKNATKLFFQFSLGKNTCHLSDVIRAHPRIREIF